MIVVARSSAAATSVSNCERMLQARIPDKGVPTAKTSSVSLVTMDRRNFGMQLQPDDKKRVIYSLRIFITGVL
jgi:hypothetical protein